jgi:hypothetical protein
MRRLEKVVRVAITDANIAAVRMATRQGDSVAVVRVVFARSLYRADVHLRSELKYPGDLVVRRPRDASIPIPPRESLWRISGILNARGRNREV